MADAAFPTAAFPGFTTAHLVDRVAELENRPTSATANGLIERMRAEIARREAVAAGDVDKMTPGERLRAARRA